MKQISTLLILLHGIGALNAQLMQPCAPGSPASDNCNQACLICTFENPFFINSANYTYDPPPEDCLGQHNNIWFAFFANAPDITFNAVPSNCDDPAGGIQMALYGECSGPCLFLDYGCNGQPVTVTATGLEIGEIYYLVIDGCNGAICDILLNVDPLWAITVPPLPSTSPIQGPSQVCAKGTFTYCIDPAAGHTFYTWTVPPGAKVNGLPGPVVTVPAPDGNCVDITFGTATGLKQVCVQPGNPCETGGQRCMTVEVLNPPPTILPPVTLCPEEAGNFELPWGGPIILTPGTATYQQSLITDAGCDSVVKMAVTIRQPISVTLPVKYLCADSCVMVGDEVFCQPGQYVVHTTASTGCDSIILFNLAVVDVKAVINEPDSLGCSASSVTLQSLAQPNGTKVWSNAAGQPLGSADSLVVTTPGVYYLAVSRTQFGLSCMAKDSVIVSLNTTPLPVNVQASGVLGCGNSTVQLMASTTIQSPVYQWSGPGSFSNQTAQPIVSTTGWYFVTVHNMLPGCLSTDSINVLIDTIAPVVTLSADTLDCSPSQAAIHASAGAGSVSFVWSGPGGFTAAVADTFVTVAGMYSVVVTSQTNHCTDSAVIDIPINFTPPDLAVSASGAIDCAHPIITLQAQSANTVSYLWTGPGGFSSNQSQPQVNLSGNYMVTVTDPEGCINNAVITVNEDVVPPDIAASGDTINCTKLIGSVSGISNTPNVLYQWMGPGGFTSNLPMPAVDTAGNYQLVVTAANGCSAAAAVIVTGDFAPPTLAVSGGVLTCTSNYASINCVPGGGGQLVTWSGPDNFMSVHPADSVSLPGVYTATVTAGNGCMAADTVHIVTDGNVPDIAASGDSLNCLQTAAHLMGSSNTPGVIFEWSGPAGFMSDTADIVVSAPGIYVLSVINPANGCKALETFSLLQDIAAPQISVSAGVLTCADTVATLQANTSVSGLYWFWTGPNSFEATNQNITTSTPGVYQLVATNPANGCTSSAVTTLQTDNAVPAVHITGADTLTCFVPQLTLTGSSDVPVQWNWTDTGGASSPDSLLAVTAPGVYQLVVTSTNGCTNSATIDIPQDISQPVLSVSGDTLNCFNGTAAITAQSSGTIISWHWVGPAGFLANTPNAVTGTAGNYTLTAQGPNGCTATAIATVATNNAVPQIQITGIDTLTCTTLSVQLTANVAAGVSGQWNTGNPSPGIDVQSPGIYTYTAIAANGCTGVAAVEILQDVLPPQDVQATGGQINCNTPTLSLTGSTAMTHVAWLWSGPDNFSAAVQNPGGVNTAGLYTLMVTNLDNGCTAVSSANVTADMVQPVVWAIVDTLTCTTQQVQIQGSSIPPDITFQWAGPANFTAVVEDPLVSLPGQYQVVATGMNGCTVSYDLVVVQDIVPPGAVAQGDTLDCLTPTGALSGTSLSTGAVFTWTGPGGYQAAGTNPAVQLPGTYTLVVTGANGCTSTAQVLVVSQMEPPALSVSGGVITCDHPEVILSATTTTGAGLEWSGPNNFQSNLATPVAVWPGEYTVTAQSTNGCTTVASVNVLIDTVAPVFFIGIPPVFDCNTTQIDLHATVQHPVVFTAAWNTTDGQLTAGATGLHPSVGQPGLYTLLISDPQNGCTTVQSALVSADTALPDSMFITYRHISCYGYNDGVIHIDSVSGGTPPLLFSLDGGAFSAAIHYQYLTPGAHTVELMDAHGCTIETNLTLLEPYPLQVDLGQDTLIELGYPVGLPLLSAVNEPLRVATFGTAPFLLESDSVIFPVKSFIYHLWVKDDHNCTAEDFRLIQVSRIRKVFIPNVFTPGLSGNNDRLTVYGGPDVRRIKSFRVYDRWGEMVYEGLSLAPNDVSLGWDGRVKGQNVAPGVFIYVAEIEFIDGETVLYKGDVSVIR